MRGCLSLGGPAPWTVVLVDLGLPEGPMAGLDVVRFVRHVRPEVGAIIMTGESDADALREILGEAARVDAYVVKKPVNLDLLRELLRREAERAESTSAYAARLFGLTPRETSLLSWVEQGNAVEEFARSNEISRSTLRTFANGVVVKSDSRSVQHCLIVLQAERLRRRR